MQSLNFTSINFNDSKGITSLENVKIDFDSIEKVISQLDNLSTNPNTYSNQIVQNNTNNLQGEICDKASSILIQIKEMQNSGKSPHEILQFGNSNLKKIFDAKAKYDLDGSNFQKAVNNFNNDCDTTDEKLKNFTSRLSYKPRTRPPLSLTSKVINSIELGNRSCLEQTMAITGTKMARVPFTLISKGIRGGSQAATCALARIYQRVESYESASMSFLIHSSIKGGEDPLKHVYKSPIASDQSLWQEIFKYVPDVSTMTPLKKVLKSTMGNETSILKSKNHSIFFKEFAPQSSEIYSQMASLYYLDALNLTKFRVPEILHYGQRVQNGKEVLVTSVVSGREFDKMFSSVAAKAFQSKERGEALLHSFEGVGFAGKSLAELQSKTLNYKAPAKYVKWRMSRLARAKRSKNVVHHSDVEFQRG